MICCCALAGTSACEHCNRRAEYMPNIPNIPFSHSQGTITIPHVNMEERRLQEIETAIKRLNKRIDEILGEENDNR